MKSKNELNVTNEKRFLNLHDFKFIKNEKFYKSNNIKAIVSFKNNLQLFKVSNLGKIDKPLTPKILSNPKHKITKHLLYLYSMESFIYSDLNNVCRTKDE